MQPCVGSLAVTVLLRHRRSDHCADFMPPRELYLFNQQIIILASAYIPTVNMVQWLLSQCLGLVRLDAGMRILRLTKRDAMVLVRMTLRRMHHFCNVLQDRFLDSMAWPSEFLVC
jgi:hypothetical protein